MEKRVYNIFLIIVFVLVLLKPCSALGITPGKIEFNFEPNFETTIIYNVFRDNPEKELSVSLEGELAKYAKVNTNKLIEEGSFILTLKLPKEVETPGKNVIRVRVSEKVDDELLEGSVGTSVTIGAALVINVPYPGKYLELSLDSNNANVGEPVDFILSVTSKGTETVYMQPKIDITSSDGLIETLYFNSREIKSQEVIKLKKSLDTTDYNPGRYKAIAIVDYGEIVRAESNFRIGELVINIINYTDKIVIGGIKAFEIGIESGWNDNIDGVYARVSIFNVSETLADFKTETAQLIPWEVKTITGYFDSSNFTKGIYDANITLIYYGKDQGKSTSELVKIEFVEERNLTLIISVIAGIIILIIVIILVTRKYFLKKKK